MKLTFKLFLDIHYPYITKFNHLFDIKNLLYKYEL